MSFAFITEFPIQGDDRTTPTYDAVNDRLTDVDAPSGLILLCAGFDEDAGVFRFVYIWDTQAQGQAYLDDKVMPAVREVRIRGRECLQCFDLLLRVVTAVRSFAIL